MSLLEPPKTKRKQPKKFPKNPDNPSPSGDPYWDNPANLADLDRIAEEYRSGKIEIAVRLETQEDIERYFADL